MTPDATGRKRLRLRKLPAWGRVALGLALAAIAWAIVLPSTETERLLVEQCTSCFAVRRTSESGLWFSGTHLVGGETSVTEDRDGALDLGPLLMPGHAHRWEFAAMHHYFFGIRNGIGCGGGKFNPVALAISNGGDVRTRIEARIRAGEFTVEEITAILALPRRPLAEDLTEPSRGHLYHRGQDLLRATGCDPARNWPGSEETAHPSACPCQRDR